jgi:hypothetical protein
MLKRRSHSGEKTAFMCLSCVDGLHHLSSEFSRLSSEKSEKFLRFLTIEELKPSGVIRILACQGWTYRTNNNGALDSPHPLFAVIASSQASATISRSSQNEQTPP